MRLILGEQKPNFQKKKKANSIFLSHFSIINWIGAIYKGWFRDIIATHQVSTEIETQNPIEYFILKAKNE